MRRRDFLMSALAAAPAILRPLASMAQQAKMPVIGVLSHRSPANAASFVAAFRRGLSETGYVEGKNVAIEYRWAEGRYDRLAALAADLVARKVDVIAAAGGIPTVLAAKRETSRIPIVFFTGTDPVRDGLVASLARPGGNLTGVSFLLVELNPKRVELISEMVPQARVIALLVNPTNVTAPDIISKVQQAAGAKGVRLLILKAGSRAQIETAFASLPQLSAGALVVANDPFFDTERDRLVELSLHYAVPAIFAFRHFAVAGGLMSYGPSLASGYRQVGVYAGKILKGAKPADLPVEQPTRFELVINLKTAKALGLTVPQLLLARADEVIQ
jgi:ABC-type uncharacterized transport system substrate-binding protein